MDELIHPAESNMGRRVPFPNSVISFGVPNGWWSGVKLAKSRDLPPQFDWKVGCALLTELTSHHYNFHPESPHIENQRV